MSQSDVRIDASGSRFTLVKNGRRADLDFRRQGQRLILLHTNVPPPINGQGLGAELVRAAIIYAQGHELAVEPRCPFAAAWLLRHPEAHDGVTVLTTRETQAATSDRPIDRRHNDS